MIGDARQIHQNFYCVLIMTKRLCRIKVKILDKFSTLSFYKELSAFTISTICMSRKRLYVSLYHSVNYNDHAGPKMVLSRVVTFWHK